MKKRGIGENPHLKKKKGPRSGSPGSWVDPPDRPGLKTDFIVKQKAFL